MSKKFIEDGHHGSSCFCCPRAAPPSTIGFANVVSAANLAASNFQAVTFYENEKNGPEFGQFDSRISSDFLGEFFDEVDLAVN